MDMSAPTSDTCRLHHWQGHPRYRERVPYFICPNCKQRSIDHDRLQEIDNVPVACDRCGFGFLFELMDDYYPAPNTGFVVCDRNGRILASGRGIFELSGYQEQELLGADLVERFGLGGFEAGQNPAALALSGRTLRAAAKSRPVAMTRGGRCAANARRS